MNWPLTIKNITKYAEYIFFSNYFYGVCSVALSIEATLQQRFPVNSFFYFALIFLITVLYYAYPYIRKSLGQTNNPRTNWYTRNYNLMRWNQVAITIILLIAALLFFCEHQDFVWHMAPTKWILLFIFPIVAAFYYGVNVLFAKYSLRKIGWLKPFVIGFTWAGLVTVYPVLFYDIIHQQEYEINWVAGLLFVKNFMFVSVLCIMFDLKDYAVDYIARLKTFAVRFGLHKTIVYMLIPLSVTGLVSFVWYAAAHNFSCTRVLLNVIPFVLLILVGWTLRKHRSLLYYLCIVDGLMLVKAICGCIAITYF